LTGVDAERYEIARPLDLQLAVLRCQRSTLLQGATDLERSVIATIVSELGSNVLKYARAGTLELRRVRHAGAAGVEIVASDAGPGIADVELALRDHYSSGRTLGLGLPGVRRMADAIEITPTAGGGTTVRVRKRLSGQSAPWARSAAAHGAGRSAAAGARWRAAASVRARSGQSVAGDHALVIDRGDVALLAIVDATGHGSVAHAVAHTVVQRLEVVFAAAAEPDDVVAHLRELHDATVGTVGAAVGLAVLDSRSDGLRYLAVGNVRAAVVGRHRFTGVSRDGVLGRRWPTPFVQDTRLHPDDLVLLWTDGLPSTLSADLAAAHDDHGRPLVTRDVAVIADRLVAGFGKDHDDAACLVARWQP
jgi:anti-sigma regulatory factor (Ser/Thr protein kinase)